MGCLRRLEYWGNEDGLMEMTCQTPLLKALMVGSIGMDYTTLYQVFTQPTILLPWMWTLHVHDDSLLPREAVASMLRFRAFEAPQKGLAVQLEGVTIFTNRNWRLLADVIKEVRTAGMYVKILPSLQMARKG